MTPYKNKRHCLQFEIWGSVSESLCGPQSWGLKQMPNLPTLKPALDQMAIDIDRLCADYPAETLYNRQYTEILINLIFN